MNIKYKIAVYYTLSAAFLLIAFAGLSYYFSAESRRAEYQDRLEYRARSIGSVIIENDHVQISLLRKLDKTTFPSSDDVRNTVIIVIVNVIFFAIFLFLIDHMWTYILEGFTWVINKIAGF